MSVVPAFGIFAESQDTQWEIPETTDFDETEYQHFEIIRSTGHVVQVKGGRSASYTACFKKKKKERSRNRQQNRTWKRVTKDVAGTFCGD